MELLYQDLRVKYSLDYNRNGLLEVKRGEEDIEKITDNQEDKEVPTTFAGIYGGPQLDIYLDEQGLRITAEREKGDLTDNTFNARILISKIEGVV